MPRLQNLEEFPDRELQLVDLPPARLHELVSGTWSLVYFYRADWCPYCESYWDQVAAMKSELEASQFRLVALSTDDEDASRGTLARHGLWFPVAHSVPLEWGRELDLYVNEERNCIEPAFFLLDPEIRIRQSVILSGPAARPHVAEFMARADRLSRR